MYNYIYLIGSLLFFIVWCLFFYLRKDLRKEMLVMSLLILPLGPISEYWYFKDYWQPDLLLPWLINIEDLIFAWSIGGIGAVVYEIFFNKINYKRRNPKKLPVLALFFGIIILSLIAGEYYKINSIYSSSFGFLIIGLIILLRRRDVWKDLIFSGFFVALIMFIIYSFLLPQLPACYLDRIWLLHGTVHGYKIFNLIPLTEMIWGFSWGIAIGSLYEFWQGYRLKKKKEH